MPLISKSSYRAPAWLPNGHLQTVFPALLRNIGKATAHSERVELPDGDFIDVEWSGFTRPRLAILSHGLEANLKANYIQGMAAALMRGGWDVLVWNFRGCGDVPNRSIHMYHSGKTEDLHALVSHALRNHPARRIDLIGFSLGGNLTLKYLGEMPASLPAELNRAVVFSVPCDLACSSRQLARRSNRIYMERFLRSMRAKIRQKNRMFPGRLDLTGLAAIRDFQEFDDRFTAPLHGFRDAEDYWARNSARQFIPGIRLPTLLVNSGNDPFLGPGCYPKYEAENNAAFHLEMPDAGGHVGFSTIGNGGEYWSETRALEFLNQE
ncbi:MAG: alpha/beta fold hydrolase [Gloeobacteraceae cyanobacterium ES-bin-144]|nr:alpha/beta fold hydrolase [Verrucomicrobiales bacterium]